MRKMSLLLAIVLLFCTACSTSAIQSAVKEVEQTVSNISDADNKYVQMDKGRYRTDNPDLTYDDAFSAFFGTPRWRYFKSDDDKDVVEFTGDCMYREVRVRALIQFVVDEENGTFEAKYLSFNEVPQDLLTLMALLVKAFEGDEDEGPDEGIEENGRGEDKGDTQTTMTVDQARGLAKAWMDMHPMEQPFTLIRDYEDVEHNGRQYYAFFLDEMHMYWFSILVNKVTGELLCRLTEDGMDPGPPVFELLDDWYDRHYGDRAYRPPTSNRSNLETLADAIFSGPDEIWLEIHWDNGTMTSFERQYYTLEWIMYSRDGNVRTVYPTFELRGDTFLIGFPQTTTRLYHLFEGFDGYFGDETLIWRLYY